MFKQEFDPKKMDEAAEAAERNFRAALETAPELKTVCLWWVDNYLKAGHKRLGRIMVRIAKEAKDEQI